MERVSDHPAYGANGRRSTWGAAAVWSIGFVLLLWVVEIIDQVLFGERLDYEGIRPGSSDGAIGILFAPLLHGGWGHLVANTGPVLVLGFLILLSGVARWVAVTAMVWIVGGIGTWLTGGLGTVHIGASILIFGWLVYLILRGIFSRRISHVLVGLVIFVLYGGALLGVFPGQGGVSWQGHLFGAIAGGLAAWWLAPEPRVRRTHRY